jgi:excisionase family DNA binding protein
MGDNRQCGAKAGVPKGLGLPDKSQFIGRIRAAELLDCSTQTLDKFIRAGRLRAFRIGRKVVVRQDELLRLVEANEIE